MTINRLSSQNPLGPAYDNPFAPIPSFNKPSLQQFNLAGGGMGVRMASPWTPMNRGVTVPNQVPIPSTFQPQPMQRDSDMRRPWETGNVYPFSGLTSLGRTIRPETNLRYDWL